ncbi:DUF5133 domain-containing protein [Streptomyces griseoviridis]|uniref:DUF5133 domain-containing protein n=1 Tax=Streptomyces griseoviridis TaxID=45398 RepID=A0A3Q9KPR7_STRGD|nr:DUF5133 domain-containing protein [Streptomyces griseoviridis]AZS83118.1 DUF5133 domain-containing protein [Streptomyces griseoviridis]QCN90025.1 DUF5133 domain-containing protein [Streptomyces griseoviridis]
MLIPHPVVLWNLLDEYEAARTAEAASPATTQGPGRRVQDIAYTLCVLTSTRDVTLALEAAHRLLGTGKAAAPDGSSRSLTASSDVYA